MLCVNIIHALSKVRVHLLAWVCSPTNRSAATPARKPWRRPSTSEIQVSNAKPSRAVALHHESPTTEGLDCGTKGKSIPSRPNSGSPQTAAPPSSMTAYARAIAATAPSPRGHPHNTRLIRHCDEILEDHGVRFSPETEVHSVPATR